jgi:hypothetical protein
VANHPPWPIKKTNQLTTDGPYTAVIHMSIPYSPIINSFYDKAPNWIVSPTALQKEGTKQFPLTPVALSEQAGMKVTLQPSDLPEILQSFAAKRVGRGDLWGLVGPRHRRRPERSVPFQRAVHGSP